ncbi:MAG: hypothetical protein WAT39_09870 [Planctomycetota bacterium]
MRIVVLTAFALTVWLCGPRALNALAARFDRAAQNSPRVVLDRVGFGTPPEWMDRSLLLAVSQALAPHLADDVAILDDDGQRRLQDGLRAVPWVEGVAIERVFPHRLRLSCSLRRPVLAVRSGDGEPLCLVDRGAVMLPWVETPLPVVVLYRDGGNATMSVEPGQHCRERRVAAAAAVALEWRDQFAPLVPDCPRLLEVDATNLGEHWMIGPHYPEIRVKLARGDGAPVVFAYDRPVDSPLARVPVATKAKVLAQILAAHPRLEGLVAGDLRLSRRWADWLQPRAPGVPDPAGRWSDLPAGR